MSTQIDVAAISSSKKTGRDPITSTGAQENVDDDESGNDDDMDGVDSKEQVPSEGADSRVKMDSIIDINPRLHPCLVSQRRSSNPTIKFLIISP